MAGPSAQTPPLREGETAPSADIIEKSIGVLGNWHLWVTFAIYLVKFPVAWHQLNIVFLAPPATFECVDKNIGKCASNCPSHVFNRSVFTETITTQWDLVCDKTQLANFAQMNTMLGILVGSVLFGYVSDRFGRRGPLVWAVIIQVLSGVGAAFVPWFWLFLVLRFICATATGGTMITSFVLIMELIGKEWRTAVASLYQIPFNLGHLSLAGIGYLLRDWKYSQTAVSAPSAILVVYYWILPESPRWLLATGKHEEAAVILERAARRNGLPTDKIREDCANYVKTRKQTKGANIGDLLRSSNLRIKTLCIGYNWLSTGMCFYGVAQWVGQLGGNIFINVALSASVQVPATFFALFAMQYVGRKFALIFSNTVTGIACLIVAFLPVQPIWPTALLGCIGMFGQASAFVVVYIFSGELYPTTVRNIGVGTSSMCARIGSMVAPFITGLSSVKRWLPPLIFCVIPLIGVLLCLILPETRNCVLPDTIEEAEQLRR